MLVLNILVCLNRLIAKVIMFACSFQGSMDTETSRFSSKNSQRVHFPVSLFSADIVNDLCKGNPADPNIAEFWVRTVIANKVLLTIGGPPCETWSAARFLEREGAAKVPCPNP